METIAHTYSFANEEAGSSGTMTFTVDDRSGVLRVVSSGFWSAKQICDYFKSYNGTVSDLHRRGLEVAAIVDLRQAQAQSADVIDLLHTRVAGLYKPGDRVAMVVSTSLVKMQMRRILDGNFHEFFLSLSAGERWALAHKTA